MSARKTPRATLKVAFDDANPPVVQSTTTSANYKKTLVKRLTPWTDPNATEKLNKQRRDLVKELKETFFPMNLNSNALAVVLIAGDLHTSESDWAAICLDIDEHKDAKVLALREEIGQKEGEEERKEVQEVPLTINRNARVEEIDSRAIMDYLIFDRGFIEEGEEEENIGACAFGPSGNAPALKKKYRMNEEKVKRVVMSVQDWGLKEGEESRKFYPIVRSEEEDEEEITPEFVGNDDANDDRANDPHYYSDEDDIIGTTMCAKRRRGNTPGSTLVRVIDNDQVPISDARRARIPFSGIQDDDDKTLSPFFIHGKRDGEGDWRGGEAYLCDKLRRNPGRARLSISRFAAEMICRELSNKQNNTVVSPIDEEEDDEDEEKEKETTQRRVEERKKRKLGGNFPLVHTVERDLR